MSSFEIVDQVKQLYQNTKLEQCIQKVEEYNTKNIQIDFNIYQIIEFYRGLSYCELSSYKQGKQIIDQLVELSIQKKGERVDEFDLIIQSLNQAQNIDYDINCAVLNNKNLLDYTLKYQKQNENTAHYNIGVYYFGLAMFKFVEQFDDNENCECIDLLKQSYDTVISYKQEIGSSLGYMFYKKKKYGEYIENKKFHINLNYPGFANLLAFFYEKLNNIEETEKYFKYAEELCPNNTVLLNNIAGFYKRIKEKEKQFQYLQKSYEINPKSGSNCLQYGNYLFENNQKELALQIMDYGKENNPDYLNLFIKTAYIELHNQNFDKGLHILQTFVENNPENSNGFQEIGDYLFENDLYNEAKPFYERYLNLQKSINAQSQKVNYNLGICQYRCELHEESLKIFIDLQNNLKKSIKHENEQVVINYILNNSYKIPHDKILQIISDLDGPILLKLNALIEQKNKPSIAVALKQKQEFFRQFLSILVYQNIIQEQLTYQSNLSHWDLLI